MGILIGSPLIQSLKKTTVAHGPVLEASKLIFYNFGGNWEKMGIVKNRDRRATTFRNNENEAVQVDWL